MLLMPDPDVLATSLLKALKASAQGFGIVELIHDDGGQPVDFRYVETNEAFDRSAGVEWATGRPASTILGDFRNPWLEGFAHVVQTGVPWRSEMLWGAHVYRAEVLPGGNGRAVILFTDITDLRTREQDLADALERHRSTELAAETGRFRWDLASRRFECSEGACIVLGLDAGAAHHEPDAWVGSIHPDDRPRSDSELLDRLASFDWTGQPWEPRIQLAGDDSRWISIRGRRIRDVTGVVLHVDGHVTDVTRRKRAEVRLMESERRFRDLANRAPVIIGATGPDGAVEFVNQAWTEFAGLPAEGWNWEAMLHPDDQGEFLAGIGKAVSQRREFSGEVRVLRHDGEYRYLHVVATPRHDPEGAFIGHAGVAYDVTDQKQAILDSQAAALAAEQANRLKSEFLAVMSHELRTPLNAIIGYSEWLLFPGAGALTATQRGDIREIASGGQRLLALVNDILDLSRIEAGEWTMEPEAVDIEQLIAQALADVAPQSVDKGLNVSLLCEPGLPSAHADPRTLRQVLVNLLGNAVKFTDSGSITVSAHAGDGVVTVLIADSGIGIPPDLLPLIFDPFRQGNSGTARRHGGTGLGLAIVQRLVELMGGTVAVASVPGEGSTFTVTVPLADEPE
jgi:PAS domain S-box-containing protein